MSWRDTGESESPEASSGRNGAPRRVDQWICLVGFYVGLSTAGVPTARPSPEQN